MLQDIIYILIVLAGIPVGLWLARTCKDEIKAWKTRLRLLALTSLIVAIGARFTEFEYKYPLIIALFFIIIVCITIAWKAH